MVITLKGGFRFANTFVFHDGFYDIMQAASYIRNTNSHHTINLLKKEEYKIIKIVNFASNPKLILNQVTPHLRCGKTRIRPRDVHVFGKFHLNPKQLLSPKFIGITFRAIMQTTPGFKYGVMKIT